MNDHTKPGKIVEGTCFTTDHEYHKDGTTIPYCCEAQEFIFCDESGVPEASFFVYTYLRSDVGDTDSRAVLFGFGGGPGGASVQLYQWGPKCIDPATEHCTAPYPGLADNPDWLIDICDIVCLDPPGTGYGRVYQYDKRQKYWGVQEDALAFTDLIKFWLHKYRRWMSPKYLGGGSYGGIRTAVLMDVMCGGPYYTQQRQYTHGIALNGAVLGCTALDFDFNHLNTANVETSSANVILTYAATNWYWNRDGKPDLDTFLQEVHEFTANQFLRAQWLCDDMPLAERESFLQQMSGFIGLPPQLIDALDLNIPVDVFCQQLLAADGRRLSMYDTRLSLPSANRIGYYDDFADDYSNAKGTFLLAPLTEKFSRDFLEIDLDHEWIEVNFDANAQWKWESNRSIRQHFASAMRRNPDMHALFFGGLFDLTAPVGAVRDSLRHSGVDRSRVIVRESPHAGHGIETNPESRREYAQAIRELIGKSVPD